MIGNDKQVVGIADMRFARQHGLLVTYALGSCIGICLYDPMIKLGALVHIMLPINMESGRTHPFKYADTGVQATLQKMQAFGGQPSRMTAKIAGGARMFEVQGDGILGSIGQRNIESVKWALQKAGIRLLREEVGGTVARTLLFDVSNGQGCVRSYGRQDILI